MKLSSFRPFFFAALALAGCATYPSFNTPFTLQTIGPDPSAGARSNLGENGGLMVYAATVQMADKGDYIVRAPQSYRIKRPDGTNQPVMNYDRFNPSPTPQRVMLPPGRYVVEAPADTYAVATVPVVIVAGRTTVVNLQNQAYPGALPPASRAVTAPQGYVAGWAPR